MYSKLNPATGRFLTASEQLQVAMIYLNYIRVAWAFATLGDSSPVGAFATASGQCYNAAGNGSRKRARSSVG